MDKETEEMFEILHKNKENQQVKETIENQIIEDRLRLNNEKHKAKIKALVSGIIILIVGILTIILLNKYDPKYMSNYIKGGTSENVYKKIT